VRALNQAGRDDVWVVDDLSDARKVQNLRDLAVFDYLDRAAFIERVRGGRFPLREAGAIFHLGACTDTTASDGRQVMETNHRYSVDLLDACAGAGVPFLYASSAAVYGKQRECREDPRHEAPLNVYAWSKLLVDQAARRRLAGSSAQIVGLRFFNVYGPREGHKDAMASLVWQLARQLAGGDVVRLFSGSDGLGDGEQRRDFVHVDDVVAVVRWFFEHPGVSGIFNVGTGRSRSFNELARAVIAGAGRGRIEYVPFPERLRAAYQSFTEADLTRLRAAGCDVHFRDLDDGVPATLRAIDAHA
jgi:ADP-L-glycero-D-manno-heptose 6-epimerase